MADLLLYNDLLLIFHVVQSLIFNGCLVCPIIQDKINDKPKIGGNTFNFLNFLQDGNIPLFSAIDVGNYNVCRELLTQVDD